MFLSLLFFQTFCSDSEDSDDDDDRDVILLITEKAYYIAR